MRFEYPPPTSDVLFVIGQIFAMGLDIWAYIGSTEHGIIHLYFRKFLAYFMDFQIVFYLIILLFSVVIHEVSHGYAALCLGDKTAEYEGRLTLNPLKHLDFIGSILVPLISTGMHFPFGWAKPVPFNPHNLRNRKYGEAIVAAAGPLSNLAIAGIFGLFVRFYVVPQGLLASPVGAMCHLIVLVNLSLLIFNLVPVPPLDGSKIISAILPRSWMKVRASIERFGFIGVIIFLLFVWQFFEPVIPWLYTLITSVPLQFRG